MTHKSYLNKPENAEKYTGLERELFKLITHSEPEVRGLTALLIGKLAGKVRLSAAMFDAVRVLLNDSNERVVASVKKAMPAIERDSKKNAKLSPEEKLIVAHGNYEELESYQTSLIVFLGTVAFCNRFVNIRSRTHDQMVQAARSGKQNIVEGCKASGISQKTELKLVGVARASLEEVLEDYKDFLRNKKLPIWEKNDPQAKKIRNLAYLENKSYKTYETYIEKGSPEVAANTLICLTHQADYLLDKQLEALETAFVEEGGFTERLYRVRSERRKKQGRR